MRRKVYTVDHEEPKCGNCDYCAGDDTYCISECGPEHGWNRYTRTETEGTYGKE